jgi:serine protein kinase
MREIERSIGVTERNKAEFRREIEGLNDTWKAKGLPFVYTTDGRLQAAIEAKLFPSRRQLNSALTQPRFARQRVEWARRRSVIATRLVEKYEYCAICAEDLIEYVTQVLKSKPVLKTPRGEGVEWLWDLHPQPTGLVSDSRKNEVEPEAAAS